MDDKLLSSTDFCFSKSNRLLKKLEFEDVLENGQRVVGSGLVLIGKKNGNEGARLGLIVSRKVGNAVVRNRVKRTLRNAFRLKKDEYTGIDVVVIARARAQSLDRKELSTEFTEGLIKLKRKLQVEKKPIKKKTD